MSHCNCPSPPGGLVQCEPGQIPACGIYNGQIEASCTNGAARPNENTEMRAQRVFNKLLSLVLKSPRAETQELNYREMEILLAGKYESEDGRIAVTFDLSEVPELLAELPVAHG